MVTIADAHFREYLRFGRMFKEYLVLKRGHNRTWHTELIVLWGPSGTGKSQYVAEQEPSAFWLPESTGGDQMWFTGYDGHDVVVVDEFYGRGLRRGMLQKMIDKNPLMVPVHGGMVPFLAKKVYITSNQDPHKWFTKLGLGGPMIRRMNAPLGRVYHVREPIWEAGLPEPTIMVEQPHFVAPPLHPPPLPELLDREDFFSFMD